MFRLIDPARRRALACFGVGALLLLLPRVAETKNCEVGSPAFGVESALWGGTLKPADAGQLPNERDSSDYNGSQRPDDVVFKTPLFTSIEIENGWIFQTYSQGFKIWDATGANASSPALVATRDCQASGFLRCLPGQHELRELFWDVDAPDGQDTAVAVASAPLGLMIFDTTNKGQPREVYQDYNRAFFQVWTASIGGRLWAFAADEGVSPGVQLYDMTTALTLNGCVDDPNSRGCGAHKGRIGDARAASYIDGLRRSDGRTFIVATAGAGGYEIWDVSNPLAASSVSGRLLGNEFILGVAMWEQGGRQLLAMQYILPGGAGQGGKVYDVTNCLNGNCSGMSPIWSKSWNISAARHFVTYSKSGSKHFLYFGNEDKCSGGLRREWLFDVSNLATGVPPVDLAGAATISVTANGETATVDYWSWYYANNPKGFSEVMPRMGKVSGNYFYRAAWTLFDVHEITGGIPPTADFSWSPAEIYPDTPVTFTSNSPGATSWTWTFPDGSATGASVSRSFSSAGTKAVKLDVSNGAGPGLPITKNVPVLDPAPAGGAVSAVPSPALLCQNVKLDATGVTGKPDLTYEWQVIGPSPSTAVVDSGSGVGMKSFTWDNTGSQTAGNYTGKVKVSNGSGSVERTTTIALQALPQLGFTTNPPACTNCTAGSPPAGTANFNVQSTGATRWEWDFNGDGLIDFDSNSTSDPADGPAPSFAYTTTGQKTVRVRISNCQVPGGVMSQDLTINIAVINPLVIHSFGAACNFNPCEFVVNQPVAFGASVSGDPTTYKYDWNGDGSFEETANAEVTTHTYTQVTQNPICPKLRIERPGEFKEQAAAACFTIANGGPPPPPPPGPTISVNGPASGQANQALSYSATASNCTPAATWSWSATGGGVVNGNGNSVQITWPNDGAKTVSVTNSGCSNATGTANVQIGGGGGGNPGTLAASFTFSPTSPQAGQAVSFTSTSTGGPTIISWDFGDNQNASGATASHTYAAPGTYNVRLDVSKPGCPDQLLGLCTATKTQAVVVGGGPPPFTANFTTTAECIAEFGVNQCKAKTGEAVQFTANAPGATSLSWSFGDGGTASGAQVSHTWSQPGTFEVRLTAGNGQTTVPVARQFVVTGPPTGPPAPGRKSVVLPWIAQSRGVLKQSSDLYVHNPGTSAMDVTLEFRKKGLPEATPPRATRTIQPGATLYVGDVLKGLFNREDVAGFISVTVEGGAEPIITSFNTTFQGGKEFGQTVAGVSMTSSATAASSQLGTQHLVGLIDNSERLAYFGVSNPGEQSATYSLRIFDKTGRQIGESSADLTVARFGQQQFQVKQIHDDFGVSNADDYRVEIETKSGGRLVPYASNLRLSSSDPSFIMAGGSRAAKVYLIGALSTPGLNNTLWQTDALLSNTSGQPAAVDVTFTGPGVNSKPTAPLHVTLAPGTTERLENVIAAQWGIKNASGVLALTTTSGAFPIVQAEAYENTNPAKRFGQSMTAVSEANAAAAGQAQYLVGLRHDAKNRTTFWLFNPGTGTAEYDVVYLGLDGKVLGKAPGVKLGAGKLRQFTPRQHPLPAAGVLDGFTVQVVVKSGKVLGGAQVVNTTTNDSAYIQGEVR